MEYINEYINNITIGTLYQVMSLIIFIMFIIKQINKIISWKFFEILIIITLTCIIIYSYQDNIHKYYHMYVKTFVKNYKCNKLDYYKNTNKSVFLYGVNHQQNIIHIINKIYNNVIDFCVCSFKNKYY